MRLLGRWRRRTMLSVGVAAAAVVLTAGTASAATAPGFYFQSVGQGANFSVLNTNNLVKGRVDDALFPLSTTGTGLQRLPFPLHVYNQTYQNAVVSSNGNIQLGLTLGQATTAFDNSCLTTTTFGHPVVLPYWDDLVFDSAGTNTTFPQGIFLKTAGTAPHRTFTVSWQGTELAGTQPEVLAQVVFKEGSQTLSYVYGTFGGSAATVGVQSKQQITASQFTCNAGLPDPLLVDMKLTLTHGNVL